MFKKRNNSKKTDLNKQLQQISPATQSQQPLQSNHHPLHLDQVPEPHQSKIIYSEPQQQKQSINKQLEDCFEEYRLMREQEKVEERKQMEEEEQQIQQQQSKENGKMKRMQVIIDDDSNEILEVVEDDGGISPDEDSEENEDNFENEIIRKTLKRQDYLRVTEGLNKSKKQSKKEALLKAIEKSSFSQIQRKIGKDLTKKTQQRDEMVQEIGYIDRRVEEKRKHLQSKRQTIKNVEEQYQSVKKILQFLYFYGNQVQNFDEDHILSLVRKKNGSEDMEMLDENDCIIMEEQWE